MSTGKLTSTKAEAARPVERIYRLSDGGGMYLEVRPDGAKYWRVAYRYGGKQKLLALGVFPAVSLKLARKKRDAARDQLAAGIDPSAAKRAQKAEQLANDLFATVAAEWYAKARQGNSKRPAWSERYAARVLTILDDDLIPEIGKLRVGEIRAPDLIRALRKVEARGAFHTIGKVKGVAQAVLAYAVGHGLAQNNPARDISPDLFEGREVKHHASITEPKRVGQLLRDIRGYSGFAVTKYALELLPLLFVRPGELRNAQWEEFDLDAAEWRIPAGRMKARETHIVPLARQAVACLRELHAITGRGMLLFPGVRHHDKPISENTFNAALRGMGYDGDTMTSHGFRSMASTLLNEQGWNRDAIERQLAHAERNQVRASYNYAEHLPERRKMMQAWADYLDRLRSGADVIEIGAARKQTEKAEG